MMKSLAALGTALVLLVGILAYRAYHERAVMSPDIAFPELQDAEIVEVGIRYGADSVLLTRSDDGVWRTGGGIPVDSARMAGALGILRGISKRERVSVDPDSAKQAEFGMLSRSAKRVRWTLASGGTGEVLVGNASGLDFNSNFWRYPDSPVIYRTTGNITYELNPRIEVWRATTFLPGFSGGDVRSVDVAWTDSAGTPHVYALERDSAGVRLTRPVEALLPAGNGEAVFEQVPELKIDGFANAMDTILGHADVLDGAFSVRATLEDGTVHRFEAGPLHDGYHFFRHPHTPHVVVKIGKARVAPFKKTVEALQLPPRDVPGTEIPTLPVPGTEAFDAP